MIHYTAPGYPSNTAYSDTFTNSDLSSGVLSVAHSLSSSNIVVVVKNNSGEIQQLVDAIAIVDDDNLTIDLTSFGTISGTWTVLVLGGGITLTQVNSWRHPLLPMFPDSYVELSGQTGLWTASGSGTNEYYFVPRISEPVQVMYNGSAATPGTLGSLSDHEWGYGDNDTLGHSTIYVRDDSGDPDGLAYGLWQADMWGVASMTYGGICEGGPVMLADNTVDQGLCFHLRKVPGGASQCLVECLIRADNTTETGQITIAGLLKFNGDGEANAQAVALTLATATKTLTGAGKWDRLSLLFNLGTNGLAVNDSPIICLYRDVSADSVGDPVAFRDWEANYL